MGYRNYTIVRKESTVKLDIEVNKKMESGYQPIGGVSLITEDLQTWYVQAMGQPEEYSHQTTVENGLRDILIAIENKEMKASIF